MHDDMDKYFEPYNAMLDLGSRIAKGAEAISRFDPGEVTVGASPKDLVFQTDKVTLHHYKPMRKGKPKTGPVLIVYGLVNNFSNSSFSIKFYVTIPIHYSRFSFMCRELIFTFNFFRS